MEMTVEAQQVELINWETALSYNLGWTPETCVCKNGHDNYERLNKTCICGVCNRKWILNTKTMIWTSGRAKRKNHTYPDEDDE
jgi:hypothetical protein